MSGMTTIRKTTVACAVAAIFVSAGVLAQSQSKVNTQDVNQSQVGMLNQQTMDLGNASNKGNSKVDVKGVNQSQAGMLQQQKMAIGNANGGKTDVKATNINQSQAGMLNQQELSVGNANQG